MNRDHVDLCVIHEFPARYLHGGSKQVLSFSFPGEKSGDFCKSSPWTREQPSTWSPRVKNGGCSTTFLLSSIGYLYRIIRKIKWYECFLIFLSKLS